MKCQVYRSYWLDEISQDEFTAHCCECAECREAAAQDAFIQQAARELEPPVPAAGRWETLAARIEASGLTPQSVTQRRAAVLGLPNRIKNLAGWQIAAALAVMVGLTGLLVFQPGRQGPKPRNILAADALQRVEAIEEEYVAAIADLENATGPLIAAADTEIMLRYRERLETIDAQIRRCRNVLAADNANAHARRYLLAAYQDKTETLRELLEIAES